MILPSRKVPHRMIFRLKGNIMGLYLVLSASLCFYIRRFKTGVFLLVSALSTFSTLGIVSAFLFLLIYLQRVIFQRKYMVWFIPAAAALGILLYLFSGTDLYQHYVYKKLFAKTEKVDDFVTAYSKADRLFSIKDAYGMGLANPVLGVGLANYARHYNHYIDKTNIDPAFAKTLVRPNSRVIPNNIYLEIWAESGGIALFCSCYCWGCYCIIAERTRRRLSSRDSFA